MSPSAVRPHLSRSAVPCLAGIALLAAGCGDTAGPALEPGNVNVLLNAVVEETDTAVIVNGTPTIRFPTSDASLWLGRNELYEFGGFPEIELPASERHSLHWTVMLTHEHPRVEKGDSLIFSFVDHGDATLAGTAMTKLTDLPTFTPGAPVRFVNFVRYLLTPYLHVDWADGGSTTFTDEPWVEGMVAGAPILVATTGSSEAAPMAGTFSARPVPSVLTMENGDPVDLEVSTVPSLDPASSLALTFSHSLDPARSFIVLVPIDRPGHPSASSAFIQPRSATSRVVIPADVLADLRGDGDGAVPFFMVIVDITVDDDALGGTFLDDGMEFSLPLVQQATTAVYLSVR